MPIRTFLHQVGTDPNPVVQTILRVDELQETDETFNLTLVPNPESRESVEVLLDTLTVTIKDEPSKPIQADHYN